VGITSLRRHYNRPQVDAVVQEAPTNIAPEQSDADKAAARDAEKAEREGGLAAALDKLNADTTPEERERLEADVKVAEGAVHRVAPAVADAKVDADRHGEVERPNRGQSLAVWQAYAEADPTGLPDGWREEFKRDDLASFYLGEK
jgi:hypothetical protein